MTNYERVLQLLLDYKPHFSSEFRDELGLLEYRKRISELRTMGYKVISLRLKDALGHNRPAYQLIQKEDLFQAA